MNTAHQVGGTSLCTCTSAVDGLNGLRQKANQALPEIDHSSGLRLKEFAAWAFFATRRRGSVGDAVGQIRDGPWSETGVWN